MFQQQKWRERKDLCCCVGGRIQHHSQHRLSLPLNSTPGAHQGAKWIEKWTPHRKHAGLACPHHHVSVEESNWRNGWAGCGFSFYRSCSGGSVLGVCAGLGVCGAYRGSLGPLELQRQCLLMCFLPSWHSLFSVLMITQNLLIELFE